jgi:prepilin-type N-terminal cleavage/methylation domain-containing protein
MTSAKNNQAGFSIVELLVVCVVIGIVASLAVPHLQKALRAAENGNVFATLRAASSTELGYYSQNGRFARITEVNNIMSGALGTNSGNEVTRKNYAFSMSPATPTDSELREGFTINATRDVTGEGVVYVYQMTQSGEITQVLP